MNLKPLGDRVIVKAIEQEEVTANLRAPLAVNTGARLGRQVTLADSTYSLRHPLCGG